MEKGYTFWIDEAKFEDIGTFSNPVASIMGGENIVQLAYDGIDVGIEDVSYSVNLPNGVDQSYTIASTYFDYNLPMRMLFASRRATKSTLWVRDLL